LAQANIVIGDDLEIFTSQDQIVIVKQNFFV